MRYEAFKLLEIHPDYSYLLDDFEAFLIGSLASLLPNEVKVNPLGDLDVTLVNRQLVLK